jgi:ESS family glutamate:Na+ symporter
MTPDRIGFALLLLGVLLYAGKWLRLHWGLAQTLFLPASILAGLLGLVIGPHALGALAATGEGVFAEGPIPAWVYDVWSTLPGLLISVVFATLLMGVPLPAPRRVWRLAGPQLAFGLSLGAGEYVIGILLVALFLIATGATVHSILATLV